MGKISFFRGAVLPLSRFAFKRIILRVSLPRVIEMLTEHVKFSWFEARMGQERLRVLAKLLYRSFAMQGKYDIAHTILNLYKL